jgi:penicillin-binding protein 2
VEKYLKDSISRRPSGIYPEYYIEKNLLPEPKIKAPKINLPADTAKKEVVKINRQPDSKKRGLPNRKPNQGVKFTAMLTKLNDDEYPAA